MQYISTRGQAVPVSAAEAIKQGIASDGGLFVPEKFSAVSLEQLHQFVNLSYPQLAKEILGCYLTDFTADELMQCITGAYGGNKFAHHEIAPTYSINQDLHVLELWHGPTCAFKDMALQMLPHLLVKAAKKTGEDKEIVILVATSGDTGKAALEGFKNVDGTQVIVFFPAHGVSEVQRLQMVTQEDNNLHVVAVEGNFDDCQTGVKQVFGDRDFNHRVNAAGYCLSSANSINWGRLVPQIVYYFYSYLALLRTGQIALGEQINFVVPTGNFGNILAGYYAKLMGLPVNRLICASNANNVLTEFINTGRYDAQRDFLKTLSPSMDILISSNLERLLFELTGRKPAKVNDWMTQLKQAGSYQVDENVKEQVQQLFWSDYASDQETLETISKVWQQYRYLVDPHTAVAFKVYQKYRELTADSTKTVILSTASPFKFNASVAQAVLKAEAVSGKSEFQLLDILAQQTGWSVPAPLKGLNAKPVLHHRITPTSKIRTAVAEILKL